MSKLEKFIFKNEEQEEIDRIVKAMIYETSPIKERIYAIEDKYNDMIDQKLDKILKRKLIEIGLNNLHFESDEYEELFNSFCDSWHMHEHKHFMRYINAFVKACLEENTI